MKRTNTVEKKTMMQAAIDNLGFARNRLTAKEVAIDPAYIKTINSFCLHFMYARKGNAKCRDIAFEKLTELAVMFGIGIDRIDMPLFYDRVTQDITKGGQTVKTARYKAAEHECKIAEQAVDAIIMAINAGDKTLDAKAFEYPCDANDKTKVMVDSYKVLKYWQDKHKTAKAEFEVIKATPFECVKDTIIMCKEDGTATMAGRKAVEDAMAKAYVGNWGVRTSKSSKRNAKRKEKRASAKAEKTAE